MMIKNNKNTYKGSYLSFIYNNWEFQMTYNSVVKQEVS